MTAGMLTLEFVLQNCSCRLVLNSLTTPSTASIAGYGPDNGPDTV